VYCDLMLCGCGWTLVQTRPWNQVETLDLRGPDLGACIEIGLVMECHSKLDMCF